MKVGGVNNIVKNYNKTKTSKKIYIKKDNKIDAVNNIDELNIDDCGLTLQEIKKKYNEYNAIIERLQKKLQSAEYNNNVLSDIDKCEIRTKSKTDRLIKIKKLIKEGVIK